ncbi:MAG: calcium-translocating P-type ATPase, PMCA-type, partial [Firmicutes bacterium]|nr:calcium-translocating P-type ATPase, PMCA-type [Bacillota bacterium]
GAICIVLGIIAKTLISGSMPGDIYQWIRLIMDAVTVAVTIIVCAVPEGLPMLTSILLSFQSLKMAKDNVLVRKINGLETAGSLSILFSDKTGTINEGRLSVVELANGDLQTWENFSELSPAMAADLLNGIGVNNSAALSDGNIIGGNSTDRALLAFLQEAGQADKINKDNVQCFNAFDSNKKSSSVTMRRPDNGQLVTFVKGAPEKIIERCTHYIDARGKRQTLNEKTALNA